MSTKNIRAVLESMRPGHPEGCVVDRALKEVEAIERAAKELLGIWGYARHDIDAEGVMESIAKDAP